MAQTKKARPPRLRFWRARQAKSQIFGVIALVLAILAVVLSLLGVFNTPISVRAGYVKQFNFQGRLTNPDGTNVDNGTYDITFKIYSSAAGGSALWAESHTGAHKVTVEDGVFNVNLGELNEIDLNFNSGAYYLGIEVNSDGEMSPRRRIGGAGYSLNTERVYGVPGSLTDTNIDTFPESERGILDALNYLNTSVIPAATLWTDTGSALRPKVGVSQDVSIPSGTLSVAGGVSFSSTLGVTGTATLDGTLTAKGTVNLGDGGDAIAISGTTIGLTSSGANNITVSAGGTITFSDTRITTPIPLSLTDNTAAFEAAFGVADRGVIDALVSLAGGGAGLWTLTGSIIHPATLTNDVAIGANSLVAPFSVDESLNTVRIGEGSAGAVVNGILNMYASDDDTGSITYTTDDRWEFSGGNIYVNGGVVGIGVAPSSARSLNIANSANNGYGVYTAMTGAVGTIYGNYASATGAAANNFGIYGAASGATAQNIAGDFSATLSATPGEMVTGFRIRTTSAGSEANVQKGAEIALAAGYTGASNTEALWVQNAAIGTGTNYGVFATTTAGGTNNAAIYGIASGATAQNYAGYFQSTLDATPGAAAAGTVVTTTSAGSELNTQTSLDVTLAAGYTGGSATYGIYVTNAAAGLGNSIPGTANMGIYTAATGSGAVNMGIHGTASGATGLNYGGYFTSTGTGASDYGLYASASGATGQNYAGYFVSTLDATPGAAAYGTYITTTSAGSEGNTQGSLYVNLAAGYTGSSATYGINVNNAAAGTGSPGTNAANYGVFSTATAGTSRIGVYAGASGAGTDDYGLYASASGASSQNYAGYFSSVLDATPGAAAYGTYITTTSAGSEGNTQASLGVAMAAGYTGASATYGIYASNAAAGTDTNYGVYASTAAGGTNNVSIYGSASGATAQNIAGDFAATLSATPGALAQGFRVLVTSAGSEANQQQAANIQLKAGYTGASNTVGINVSNAAVGTGTNYGVNALANSAGTNNVGIYGRALNGTAQNYAGDFSATLDATPGATAPGFRVVVASAGSEGNIQRGAEIALNAGYTGASNTQGVAGINMVVGTGTNSGVYGTAGGGGTNNAGVYGVSSAAATNNYGGYFTSSGTATNYGVYGTASGSSADTDIAGYFTAANATTAKYVAEIYNTGTNATSDALKISIATNPAGNTNTFIQFVDGSGNIGCVRGNTGAVQYQTTGEDFAEYFPRAEELSNGAVVSLRDDGKIKKAQPGEKPFGVISGTAGFAGGRDIPSNELVALVGQVAVDVTNEGGSISAGDTVTISSRAGFAKKVQAQSDPILGVALQSFTGREGQVKILISALSGILSASSADSADGNGDLINGGTINGNLGIKGELDVTGTIKAASLWSQNATWHIDSLGEAVFQKITAGDIELQEGDNKALGSVTLPGNQKEIFVPNTSITAVSRIFLTIETTNDAEAGVKVKEKRAGQGFVISTLDGKVAPVDLPVDWLIIN